MPSRGISRIGRLCLHVLLLVLLATLGFAQPASNPIRLENSHETLVIGDRIGVLQDAAYPPGLVRSGALDAQFQPGLKLESLGVYWLRVQLENATQESRWRLRLEPFRSLEWFADEGVQANGDRIPYRSRACATDLDILDAPVPPQSLRTFYIRAVARESTDQLKASILSRPTHDRQLFREALEMAFIQGILLVMVAYNIMLYRSLRDGSYLSYSAFILSLSFYLLLVEGFFNPLTGLDTPVALRLDIAPLLAVSLFIHFSCAFLQAPSRFPAWNSFWTGFISTFSGLTILEMGLAYHGGASHWVIGLVYLQNLLIALAAVLMTVFTLHAWRRGYGPARYFLQANLAFFACFLLWMAGPNFLRWVDLGALSRSALHLGVILQVTLFSLALGGRFKALQAEKEAQARDRLLEIQRMGVERNQELKAQVAERTKELDTAHQELAQAQEKLGALRDAPLDHLEDISQWAAAMAEDFQATLGVAALGVFELRSGTLVPIRPLPDAVEPDMDMVLASLHGHSELAGMLVIPARGLSGELRGVVVVRGFAPQDSRTGQRQLLNGFASHLGNAFEMAQIQHKLKLAESTRATTLEEYQAKGIELLKLCPVCGAGYSASLERCLADGAELEMPGFLPLRVLDRYRFIRRLGEGGMGTVLEALDEKLDRAVAIKLMRPEHFHDLAARLRFEREVHTLLLVNHPGVVTVYDSGELGDGTLYLIMERLRGLDLAALIHRHGPGSPVQVARLLRQGAAALVAAHLAQVVHRDIKPQNFFLTPGLGGFQARLLDFGLAKEMNATTHLTQTGFMMGTPVYMAPEQILGRPVTPRTDTFAFASVIHQALLGHPPVRSTVLSEIISAILYAPLQSLRDFAPWLPESVDEAFAAALAKDPLQRPADLNAWAGELAAVLERLEDPGGWPDPAHWDQAEGGTRPGDQPTATFPNDFSTPG